jgi:hypothetical protein
VWNEGEIWFLVKSEDMRLKPILVGLRCVAVGGVMWNQSHVGIDFVTGLLETRTIGRGSVFDSLECTRGLVGVIIVGVRVGCHRCA